jgi:hypothetical protein
VDVTSARYPARRRPPRRWDLWALAARAVGVLGLACGILVWSVAGVAGTTVSLVALSWCLLLVVGVKGPRRNRAAVYVGAGIAGGAGLVAGAGLAGVVLLLLVGATSPFVRFLGRSGRRTPLEGHSLDHAVPPDEPGPSDRVVLGEARSSAGRLAELSKRLPRPEKLVDLDDSALCLAWRQSFVSLSASMDAGSVLELVELREQYLDELTRRHPAEIARWLASGARAAGNPMRFLAS